jgi:NDP-sugar pyrophosphorylase family protein
MSVSTAVVLAAGEGTRLRPLTRNRPKPMLPAADRPILEYVFDALVEAGMDRLVCVVGYKHDRVQDHFGPTYRDRPIEYVRQHKQLGSGHALLQARSAVDGPALVVNGDRLVEVGMVERVVDTFERDDPAAALAVLQHPDAQQYGAVVLQNDEIVEIIEKPTTDDYRLINAGIYAFGADIFDAIADTPRSAGELALTDTISRLVDEERVQGVHCEGMWVDATYPSLAVARTRPNDARECGSTTTHGSTTRRRCVRPSSSVPTRRSVPARSSAPTPHSGATSRSARTRPSRRRCLTRTRGSTPGRSCSTP